MLPIPNKSGPTAGSSWTPPKMSKSKAMSSFRAPSSTCSAWTRSAISFFGRRLRPGRQFQLRRPRHPLQQRLANGLGNLASRTAALIEKKTSLPKFQARRVKTARRSAGHGNASRHRRSSRKFRQAQFARALETIWTVIAAATNISPASNPGPSAIPSRTISQATVLWTNRRTSPHPLPRCHFQFSRQRRKVWTLLGQSVALANSNWTDSLGPTGARHGSWQIADLVPTRGQTEAIERIESMANEELNPPKAAPAPAASTPRQRARPQRQPPPRPRLRTKSASRISPSRNARRPDQNRRRIVGADKLLKLTVDIGTEIRQICAGIAQYYEPESSSTQSSRSRQPRPAQTPRRRIQRHDRSRLRRPRRPPVLTGFHEEVEVGARTEIIECGSKAPAFEVEAPRELRPRKTPPWN